MSTVTSKIKSVPPAAGKKKKLQSTLPNSLNIEKPSKVTRSRESRIKVINAIKDEISAMMMPLNDDDDGGAPLIIEDKDNKKVKKGNSSDDGLVPRSSFRLYLRRQTKAHEMKKRAEQYVRTVELIKRPIELKDPATKILFLASLDLYPKSESGGAPIVLIKQSSSGYEHTNDSSESSESSEKDFPIIEVVSDQDQDQESMSTSTLSGDSFSISEFCKGLKTEKVVSSTPNLKRRKKNNQKVKVNGTKSASMGKRKPLVQREHNSISIKATVASNVVENAPNAVDDWRPFKCEVPQPQPDIIQCVQPKVPEIKSEIEPDKFADLESIKRMLAKLHTRIAPAREQIQLITIE